MTPNVAAHHIGAPRDRRVLVVEDDEDVLESMSSILEDAGYRVDTCANGKDALERLQQRPADAIVLDLMMPVMNGWEFVTAKKEDPSIAHIPVVAISADSSAKATAIGAQTYIPKPFDAADLVAAVGRVLFEADRRKLAEGLEETEQLVLLGTIAAGVGHEINNPLSVVMSSVELIERTFSTIRERVHLGNRTVEDQSLLAAVEEPLDRIQGQLHDCHAGLDRVREIIRDLRSVSRRAGDKQIEIDLGHLIESVMSMTGLEISPRVDLVRTCDPGVKVLGNETRLGQVFLNLLINALQSIPKDQVEHQSVFVDVRRAGAHAVVEVRDTGRGMSGAQMERIFDAVLHDGGRTRRKRPRSRHLQGNRRRPWRFHRGHVGARSRELVHGAPSGGTHGVAASLVRLLRTFERDFRERGFGLHTKVS